MVGQVLAPGMKDGGDSQGGLEVVAAELQQGGRGAGKQERVEAGLVVLDERIQLVREGEDDVEVGDGQQVFDLLLQPVGAVEPLASRTMAIATGMRHEVLAAAVGTLILMAAQRGGVAGGDGAQHLPMMSRQTMRLRKVRQGGADNFAQGEGRRLTGSRIAGHGGARRRLGVLPGPAKIDQVQRTADVLQAFLAHMEVGRRGREPAMAEQALKCQQIDTRFQQVGSKRVTIMPSSA